MRRFTCLLSSVLIILNLSFSVAKADTIEITLTNFSQGRTVINHSNNGNAQRVYAGMFNLETSNPPAAFPWLTQGGQIDAFCVELEQYIYFDNTIESEIVTGASYFDSMTADLIGRLFTGAFDSVTEQISANEQRVYSSAFQMALWEIVYDSSSIDLSSGFYQTNQLENTDVLAQANSFLSNLSNPVSAFDIFVLQNDLRQDLVIVNPKLSQGNALPVSAPSTIGVFALALSIIGWRLRARKV